MNKLRVFEAFAGYGSQIMALKRIGVQCEVVAISEIDKQAIIAYDAIHTKDLGTYDSDIESMKKELQECNVGLDTKTGKIKIPKNADQIRNLYNAHKRSKNLGNISLIDPNSIPDHDLFTYSFPCQDISNIGMQRGFSEGEGTRSGLLWECKKVIEAKKPDFLLMENVKNIVSKKHMPNFVKWCEWLETQGYKNYWKVLNAKDYGIPQNRERCFMVSIRNGQTYNFPQALPLEKKLRNFLEAYVQPKYYLKTLKDFFILHSFNMESQGNGFRFSPHIGRNADVARCILTRAGGRMDDNYIIELDSDKPEFLFASKNPDIVEFDNGKIKIKESESGRILTNDEIKIRKLTNLECFRLMGVNDEDSMSMINAKIPDGELFKLAGNSIVVNVLEEIFRNLFLSGSTVNEEKKDVQYHTEN